MPFQAADICAYMTNTFAKYRDRQTNDWGDKESIHWILSALEEMPGQPSIFATLKVLLALRSFYKFAVKFLLRAMLPHLCNHLRMFSYTFQDPIHHVEGVTVIEAE